MRVSCTIFQEEPEKVELPVVCFLCRAGAAGATFKDGFNREWDYELWDSM
jgi:hypothetical protein